MKQKKSWIVDFFKKDNLTIELKKYREDLYRIDCFVDFHIVASKQCKRYEKALIQAKHYLLHNEWKKPEGIVYKGVRVYKNKATGIYFSPKIDGIGSTDIEVVKKNIDKLKGV